MRYIKRRRPPFVVKILTDNDAFGWDGDEDDNPYVEIARILRKLANDVERTGDRPVRGRFVIDAREYVLRDFNGNTVGEARFLLR